MRTIIIKQGHEIKPSNQEIQTLGSSGSEQGKIPKASAKRDSMLQIDATHEDMRTIIIEQGHEIKPYQYKEQIDIGKVIVHEGAKIGHNAFNGCTGITKLTIAKDVEIGECAFYKCSGITNLNIAEGMTVRWEAFYECTGITELTIAKGVPIGTRAFWGCTGITEVNIARRVSIGVSAFDKCTGIIELNIAKGTIIRWGAFDGCTGITKLSIAEGVIIGNNAFNLCTGITELNIAQGVIINEDVFNFNTVERFSMPEPIMCVSRQLMLRISELFETLRNKGHQEFNMTINRTSHISYQGVQSLQSLCVNTIVGSDGIKDFSMAKSILHSQQLLASEEIEKYRCFILERNDQCTRENSKADVLYTMICN